MRIVSEYRQRADECRKLARLAANLEARKVFEDMAQNLDLLADVRIGDIESKDQSPSVSGRHSQTIRFRSIT